MPKYISNEGEWHAQKERVALKNLSNKVKVIKGEEIQPGQDYIYEGPDRAALFELYKEKVETFGENFRSNPEFLQAIRNQGFNTVEDYLKAIRYDKDKSDKDFKERAAIVSKGQMKDKVAAVNTLGGGMDTAGDAKPRYGNFGPPPRD